MIRSEQPVFWQTHRIIMALIGAGMVVACVMRLR